MVAHKASELTEIWSETFVGHQNRSFAYISVTRPKGGLPGATECHRKGHQIFHAESLVLF